MEERKKHQPPLSLDEQIANLKSLGLIIEDENEAKRILNDISYFRLIKGYSPNLKEKNGTYHNLVTFDDIKQLYLFNANFRQAIFPQIEKIEINVRCRISNYIAEKYGIFGYKNSNNFVSRNYHQQFLLNISQELHRNAKSPFVKNFQENYEGGDLPIYALVEIFSFGTLSKFYKNMKSEDKKEVARTFEVGYLFLESWLEAISYVRNICAHYGRLYNAKLVKRPSIYKEYTASGIVNYKVFAVLLCMKQLLKGDTHWNLFVDEVDMLIDKYEEVDIKTMGFPDNWKRLLAVG